MSNGTVMRYNECIAKQARRADDLSVLLSIQSEETKPTAQSLLESSRELLQ